MANVEMLHGAKNNEGALLKIQHICEGLNDLLERLEKHRDRLRDVNHEHLDAIQREKPTMALVNNVDTIARLLAKCDQTFADIEQIF